MKGFLLNGGGGAIHNMIYFSINGGTGLQPPKQGAAAPLRFLSNLVLNLILKYQYFHIFGRGGCSPVRFLNQFNIKFNIQISIFSHFRQMGPKIAKPSYFKGFLLNGGGGGDT